MKNIYKSNFCLQIIQGTSTLSISSLFGSIWSLLEGYPIIDWDLLKSTREFPGNQTITSYENDEN